MLIKYPDSDGETTPGFVIKFKKDVEVSNATGASSITFTHELGKVIVSNDGRGGCDRYEFIPKTSSFKNGVLHDADVDAMIAVRRAWDVWVEENVDKMLPFLKVLSMEFAKEDMVNRTGEYIDYFATVFSEMFLHGFITKSRK